MRWEGPNFLKDGNFILQEEPIENSISKEHLLSEIKTLVVNKTRDDITDIGYRVIKTNSLDQKFVSVRNKRENQELLLKPFLTSTESQN